MKTRPEGMDTWTGQKGYKVQRKKKYQQQKFFKYIQEDEKPS